MVSALRHVIIVFQCSSFSAPNIVTTHRHRTSIIPKPLVPDAKKPIPLYCCTCLHSLAVPALRGLLASHMRSTLEVPYAASSYKATSRLHGEGFCVRQHLKMLAAANSALFSKTPSTMLWVLASLSTFCLTSRNERRYVTG